MPVGITEPNLPNGLRIERHFLQRWRAQRGRLEARSSQIEDGAPEDKLIARERAEAMRAALERLTPAERAVILLRDYSGLSAPEAAIELEISVEKVGSRLFRARRRLGALLQSDWPGLFPAHEL